ncbi:uncharacterized protein TRAVEDRAFT_64457 [Trametes versicolor FP-101664 SS1]|uniref:uncharacterized protein n=1 Tax=Trametes versicolor (strain FP-101664) TaxID=717944 RepID=UPI000462464D|nr:uncharacterized protein TRAVEDRAFT_64457 [Trametes versicolor FP-101664 SS1]EIW59381.1 hypothetical protein TRAVEDRAFT_64457 [Trametes versicolor FP-101664 SS1]
MPSASSSSNPVSDALTSLTRAASVAFNAVQEQAQTDVAQARAERDDALRVAQEARLDAKDLELREEGWRAALDKSDMTIKHQADTIAQLRNEVDQWKTQLTRLEESSRQEIDDWKEQYRRAEHERTRLSARIDELITGQLAWNAAAQVYTTPYAPRIAYTDIAEASTSSSGPRRASTVSHSRRPVGTPHGGGRAHPDTDGAPSTSRKPRVAGRAHAERDPQSRSRGGSPTRLITGRRKEQVTVEVPRASGSRTAPRTSIVQHPSPPSRDSQVFSAPRQQVIRRVTAFVDVKEEESDGGLDDQGSARSGSVYEPDDVPPIPPSGRRQRASQPTVRRKKVLPDWDEDEQTPDVGDDASQFEEDPEPEDEEEDDELLLGPKKSKPSATNAKQPRVHGAAKGQGAAKNLKRKLDANTSVSSGRASAAKTAKTR